MANAKLFLLLYGNEFGRLPIDIRHIHIYLICMHRTTILLPESLQREAEREAGRLGISLGELIRRRLRTSGAKGESGTARFFSRKPWTGRGAADMAERHDDYLYGE